MTLEKISPSQIEAFDHNSTFGCQRRWFFRYVLRLPEEQSPNATLGTQVHSIIEDHLMAREPTGQPYGTAAVAVFCAMEPLVNRWAALIDKDAIELAVRTSVAGVPVFGRIDALLLEPGILDWKTTSDLKYAKKNLTTATPMVLYAKWFFEQFPKAEVVDLVHIYGTTKTPFRSKEVIDKISREQVDTHVNNVIVPIVDAMKKVALETDISQVPYKESFQCRVCSYSNRCPRGEQMAKASDLMAKFRTAVTPAAPVPSPIPESTQANVVTYAKVLPPDAPASDPAINAKPVEGFTDPRKTAPGRVRMPIVDAPAPAPQVEAAPVEEKRKRGRPTKEETQARAESKQPAARVHKITVTHGLTLNLGNFNSARVDISLESEAGGDYEATYAELTKEVKLKLATAIDEYQKFAAIEVKK